MKKYNAINITSYYNTPDSLSMFKKTITTRTNKSGNSSRFDQIIDNILYEYSSIKELYRVPEGRRARLMTMSVKLPSELEPLRYEYKATETHYDVSDGHMLSTTIEVEDKYSANERGCVVKINNMMDDITNPFILGAYGSTKQDILPFEPSGSNFSIKSLENFPIYLKSGDTLSLRSCFSFSFDFYRQGYREKSSGRSEYNYKREITKEEIFKNSNGLCYISILEEYDE